MQTINAVIDGRTIVLGNAQVLLNDHNVCEIKFAWPLGSEPLSKVVHVLLPSGYKFSKLLDDDTLEITREMTAQSGKMLFNVSFMDADTEKWSTFDAVLDIFARIDATGDELERTEPTVIDDLVAKDADHESRIVTLETTGGGGTGVSPHIDETTGNWFVGDIDTGIHAQGPQGNQGEPGPQGSPGANGTDGANGVTPHIDEATGNWFIGTTDTGIHAQGVQGIQGPQGNPGTNGTDGAQGPQGEPGIGIVAGGTTGQVLSKKSATDYDTEWITPSAAGGSTYPRGTAFPVSPTNGDAFYRTDRKILYLYEGWWQPIESYGAIDIYLSATGSDSNGGFASTDAVQTLVKAWELIPRLYGGNVTVHVTGEIVHSGANALLGGKYPVAGAYTIAFVGDEGGVFKTTFSGTIDESTNAGKGAITGLTGLTVDAYAAKILKNTTRNWETLVYDNTSTQIRSVGLLASYRTAASSDTWEVRDFGASIVVTSGALISVETPVIFERLKFSVRDIASPSTLIQCPANATFNRCAFVDGNVQAGRVLFICKTASINDGYFENNKLRNLEVKNCGSLLIICAGFKNAKNILYVGTYGYCGVINMFRANGAGGTTAISVTENASMTLQTCAGSNISNFAVGVSCSMLSRFSGLTQITNTATTPSTIDSATFAIGS